MKKAILCLLVLFIFSQELKAVDYIISVTTTVATMVGEAFTNTYGWSATLPDGSLNIETKAQFTLRMIKKYIGEVTKSYQLKKAAQDGYNAQVPVSEGQIQIQ